MLTKTIEYEDYNGTVRTEDFYFNLNPTELRDLQYSKEGGFQEYFEKIKQDENIPEMIRTIEELVLLAFGIKSDDGRHFEKSDRIAADFKNSMAYQELFMELMTNPKEAAGFFMGLLPLGVQKQIAAGETQNQREYTADDLLSMDQKQFDAVAGTDEKRMTKAHLMAAYRRRIQAQVA